MDRPIHVGLERVAMRFRLVRLAWQLSLVWACLAIAFSLIQRTQPGLQIPLTIELPYFGPINLVMVCWFIALISVVLLIIGCCRSYRNKLWTASQIEAKHPDLKQRLITFLNPRQANSSSFLRKQLLKETLQHVTQNRWESTVPPERLITAWTVQLLALILAFYAGSKANRNLNAFSFVPSGELTGSINSVHEVVINPGDIELERGTDLVITARFPEASLPLNVWVDSTPSQTERGSSSIDELPSDHSRNLSSPNSKIPHSSPLSTLQSAITTSPPFAPSLASSLSPSLETIHTRVGLERSLSDPVFGGYLRRIAHDLDYKVAAEGYESELYKIRVFDYPNLERSNVTIQPPSYVSLNKNQEPRTVENTRRITVAEGSELTWNFTVNKDLDFVLLLNTDVSGDDEQISFEQDPNEPLLWNASFTAVRSSEWELRLVDEVGRQAKFIEKFYIKVLPNQPPEIKLATAQDLVASPLQEILLKATVKNEFGIHKTGVTIITEGFGADLSSVENVTEIPCVLDKNGIATLTHQLDLEKLQSEPDDLISYFFWAEDLDTNGRPRRTDGEMFFVEVRPFEEIFREGDSSASEQQSSASSNSESPVAEQAAILAELQKKLITGTWNLLRSRNSNVVDNGGNNEVNEDVQTLLNSQKQALQLTGNLESTVQDAKSRGYLEEIRIAMRTAIEHLDVSAVEEDLSSLNLALTSERRAYEGLLKLKAREHSIVRSRQQSQSSQSRNASQQSRQDQIDQLELDPEDNTYQTEQQASESEPTTADREARQVMNRLDELARRQQDINEQLKQMETAIREADTQKEKEDLEEQLKRLRENQEELLRDTDELIDRMNQPDNRQAMQESREQVEQARDQLQHSSQSLSQGETSSALNSGSRAQRQMDETREQLRKDSSNQLQQSMQGLVEQARRIESEQQRLQNAMSPQNSEQSEFEEGLGMVGNEDDRTAIDTQESLSQSPFRNSGDENRLPENASPLRPTGVDASASQATKEWSQLKTDVDQLLDQVKQTVQESETSEPILAEKLYETYRDAKQSKVDQKIDHVRQLLDRGLSEPARRLASDTGPQIERIRTAIENASEQILGSEQESLRRVLRELNESREAISNELNAEGIKTPSENFSNSISGTDTDSATSGSGTDSPPSPSLASSEVTSSVQVPNEAELVEQGEDKQGGDGPGLDGSGVDAQNRNDLEGISASDVFNGNASTNRNAPLTGSGYQQWSDRLREAEELLRDQQLKNEVSRIRESAREMRIRYRRDRQDPDWDAVQKTIMEPLDQLKQKVNEELLRQAAERNSLVPIDRDPVPRQFQQKLESYYENLGLGASQP